MANRIDRALKKSMSPSYSSFKAPVPQTFSSFFKQPQRQQQSFSFKQPSFKPASVPLQKQWQSFSFPKRAVMRMTMPNFDKDSVPDKFDCQPTNPKKHMAFKKTCESVPNYDITNSYPYDEKKRRVSKNIKTVLMKPEDFLMTTYKESQLQRSPYISFDEYKQNVLHQKSIDWLKQAIPSKAKKNVVPIPFLEFDAWGRPTGHEGRNRSQAAIELGMKAIPVTIEQKKYIRKEDRGYLSAETPPSKFDREYRYNPKDVKTFLNLPAYKEQVVPEEDMFKGDYGIDEKELKKYEKDFERKVVKEKKEREKQYEENKRKIKEYEDSLTDEDKIQLMLIEEKINNAPVEKQQEFQEMTEGEQAVERITKPDLDGDNVPNEYDCVPDDATKQDFKPSYKNDDMTAAQKFGQKNINRLQRIGQGRDRVVYALDNNKVLKVAKNIGGINQNIYERDLDYLGQIKHYETGKDYVVMEKANKAGQATTQFLKPFKKLNEIDFTNHTDAYQNALGEDNNDFLNFNISGGDFKRKVNWGEKEGQPVLIDGGTLHSDSLGKYRLKDFTQNGFVESDDDRYNIQDWQDIQFERRRFRNKGKEDNEYKQELKDRGYTFPIPPRDDAFPKVISAPIVKQNRFPYEVKPRYPDREGFNIKEEREENIKRLDEEAGYQDNDKDGIINSEDCEPNNPEKQGTIHDFNPASDYGELEVYDKEKAVELPNNEFNDLKVYSDNPEIEGLSVGEYKKKKEWFDIEDEQERMKYMEEQKKIEREHNSEIFDLANQKFTTTRTLSPEQKLWDMEERANLVYPLDYTSMEQWKRNILGTDLEGVDTPDNYDGLAYWQEHAVQRSGVISNELLQEARRVIAANPKYFKGKDKLQATRLVADRLIKGYDWTEIAEEIQASDSEVDLGQSIQDNRF